MWSAPAKNASSGGSDDCTKRSSGWSNRGNDVGVLGPSARIKLNGRDVKDVARVTGAIASGDPEAFALLYRARFGFVYSIARRTTSFGEDDCLDVVQDTMIRVVRHMRRFEDIRALDRWLVCLTRSVSYDHLRGERRRRQRERVAADHRAMTSSGNPQDLTARLEWIRRELRGIDRVTAEIIELRFRGGLTLKAIGARLGMSIGAVHGRMVRAIGRLRQRASEQRDE